MISLRIYSGDPFIRELNDEASLKLNHRGCVIFNRALEVFKKLEENMELHAEGVLERFKDDREKVTILQEHHVIVRFIWNTNLLVVI